MVMPESPHWSKPMEKLKTQCNVKNKQKKGQLCYKTRDWYSQRMACATYDLLCQNLGIKGRDLVGTTIYRNKKGCS